MCGSEQLVLLHIEFFAFLAFSGSPVLSSLEIFLVPFDPGWLPDPELLERIDAEATLIQEEKGGEGNRCEGDRCERLQGREIQKRGSG